MKIKNIICTTLLSLPLLGIGAITGCAVKQKQETVGQYVDGGVITAQVKSKILADKKLHNTTITVKTYQNTVQLSGFVNTTYQKKHAELLALTVENVKSVDNALLIKN